jgi:hypothetical protein
MTTLQITSLSQVKKLLDYGGMFVGKNKNGEEFIASWADNNKKTISIRYYNDGIEDKAFSEKNIRTYPLTFHSWLLAPPLEEGEEVWCIAERMREGEREKKAYKYYVERVSAIGGIVINDKEIVFNSHYAIPCRLLEEGKEEIKKLEINLNESRIYSEDFSDKLNEVIDAVNELRKTAQHLGKCLNSKVH